MDEPLPVPHNDMQWARGRECEDNIHGCSRPFSYGKADQSHSFRTSVRSFFTSRVYQALLIAPGSMGDKNNSDAVVDTNGRVYGVQSLRVVDVSIFLLLPPGL